MTSEYHLKRRKVVYNSSSGILKTLSKLGKKGPSCDKGYTVRQKLKTYSKRLNGYSLSFKTRARKPTATAVRWHTEGPVGHGEARKGDETEDEEERKKMVLTHRWCYGSAESQKQPEAGFLVWGW